MLVLFNVALPVLIYHERHNDQQSSSHFLILLYWNIRRTGTQLIFEVQVSERLFWIQEKERRIWGKSDNKRSILTWIINPHYRVCSHIIQHNVWCQWHNNHSKYVLESMSKRSCGLAGMDAIFVVSQSFFLFLGSLGGRWLSIALSVVRQHRSSNYLGQLCLTSVVAG